MIQVADNAFVPGKKHASEQLGSVLILGLGKSGKVAATYCAGLLGTRVASLCVAGGVENEASKSFVGSLAAGEGLVCGVASAAEGADVASGESAAGASLAAAGGCLVCEFGDDAVPALADAVGGRFDLCIASPGIPYWAELYQDALRFSDEVISEVEFAWRESAADSRWVAITGTNGKTTTTACCAAILEAAGLRAAAVGNIGDVCLSAVAAGKTDVYVAEVSSYQLASTKLFAPNVAVCLNITPDHIHWHKTLAAYRDAKFKVLANLASVPGAVAVLDAANDVVRAKVREFARESREERGFDYVPMGTAAGISGDMRHACGSENAAFIDACGMLCVAFAGTEHALCHANELKIHGLHNASNALAAATAAVALGVPDEDIRAALKAFAPLEHRIEPCGSIGGVLCVNDSKATNVDATLKALSAFPDARPIVLLGGDDKGTGLSALVAEAHKHTRAVVCFGAAGARFKRAFADGAAGAPADFRVLAASHMEDALDVALGIAGAGDVVLLSPACASFDEFHSFEERGDVFKRLVAKRAGAAGKGVAATDATSTAAMPASAE